MKLFNKLLIGSVIIGSILGNQVSYAHGEGDHDHGKVKDVPNLPFSLDFIENKGQWDTQAKYKVDMGVGTIFITNDGFMHSYASSEDFERMHELSCGPNADPNHDFEKEMIRMHAYRVKFIGSNPDAKFTNENKRKQYHNYFIGNDESKWAGKVGLYGQVTQNNIYQGVDLKIYSSENQSFKYDFIVQPGANPSNIKLSYDGVIPAITEDGKLLIKTSVNEVIENAPYTYQIINNQKVQIACNYKIDRKGVLSFEFPNGYDTKYELVIDPELVFATYSGSSGSGSGMYAYATGYDFDGSMFAGAKCWHTGWPTTTGAFMVGFPGGNPVGINKYTPDGLGLIYSTYFGGTAGNTLPYSLRVNNANELYLAGVTNSTNIPVTSGAFNATNNGGQDLYIAHFSFDGSTLIGSTYMGTSGTDGQNVTMGGFTGTAEAQNTTSSIELNFDANNNVWAVSNVTNATFPLTSNAMQLTYGGGPRDGVVFSLNSTLSTLLYSSFVGGSGDDAALALTFLSNGHIAICGATNSTDFPTTTGVMNPSALGGQDGFVRVFNPTVGNIMASTYIGTASVDHVTHILSDEFDNIYILGRNQNGTYPIYPNTVYSKQSGSSYIFIDVLNTDLSASQQSTIVGGAGMFPTAFLVDICRNVYFGAINVGAGMPLTQDAFQTAQGAFYFMCLSSNFAEVLFGSYYGTSDHTHVGVNRLDPNGNIYHSLCVWSGDTWVTHPANVFAPLKNPSLSQDIVSFKFNFDKAGVNAEFKLDPNSNPRDSGCVPFMVNFANNSTQVVDFYWDFGDGGTSTLQSPSHTYTTPGTYTIELITVNDTACVTHDTAYLTVYVFQLDTPQLVVRDTVLCNPEDEIDIFVEILNPSSNTLGNIIRWTSNPQTAILTANDLDTVTVNPNLSLTYTVTVWDSIPHLCSAFRTAQVNIDLSPRELKMLTNDTTVCYGDTIQVRAVGTQGYTYHWTPATGVSDTTALEPEIVVTQPNIYILTSSYPFCLDTSVMFSVDVEHYPVVSIDAPKEACRYTEAVLNSNVTPFRNDYTYTWTPNTNLSNSNLPNTILTADTTATYRLTVRTPAGCTGSDEISIAVHPGNFGDAISDMGYCPPGEVELWATGGEQYRWTPSIGLSNDTIYNPKTNVSTTTTYTVYITDANNCEDTFDVIVTVYPLAVLSLPDSVVIHKGESYRVAPNTNCLYFNWFPPSGVSNPQSSDPDLNPIVRTKYYVTARTENGCETTDSMIVMVDGSKFEIPNAFAPGGGKVFKPINRGDATLNTFAVYNRWGNKIFETKNIDEGWDGTYNGAEQSAGVYVYIVDAIARDGEPIQMQGNVTLVR